MLLTLIAVIVWHACSGGAQPPDAAAAARRAGELVAAGNPGEAVRIYQDLLRASPDNADLLLNLSIAEYTAKRHGDAIEHAQAALRSNSELLPARLFLGAAHLALGDFARAAESLALVVAASPRERNARLMLGEALLGTGKAAGAVAHFQAVAELLPSNPRVWYGLAQANEALGRPEAAADAWKRLAALPPSVESHMHAAQIQDAGQRWGEAAAAWRAALDLAPDHRPARVGLAWSLYRRRDYDAARAALEPLRTTDPRGGRAGVRFLYGASLLNQQQTAAAIPHLRDALAQDASLIPARAALGQALLQIGQAEEAIPLLRDAAPADTDGTIHFQLFRACQLTRRDAEARDALAAYRRLRARSPAP